MKPLAVVFEVKAMYASSSIGRAAVSKTAGWGFKSLLACHSSRIETGDDGRPAAGSDVPLTPGYRA